MTTALILGSQKTFAEQMNIAAACFKLSQTQCSEVQVAKPALSKRGDGALMMALLWLMHSHRGGKISLVEQSGTPVRRFNKFHPSFSGTPRELNSFMGHKTFSAKTGPVLGKLGS